jgi:hypothetical protein
MQFKLMNGFESERSLPYGFDGLFVSEISVCTVSFCWLGPHLFLRLSANWRELSKGFDALALQPGANQTLASEFYDRIRQRHLLSLEG